MRHYRHNSEINLINSIYIVKIQYLIGLCVKSQGKMKKLSLENSLRSHKKVENIRKRAKDDT